MAKKPNPLLDEARKLPKPKAKTGTEAWYQKLRRANPAEWAKLCEFMDEWTNDKSPNGVKAAIPYAGDLFEFLKASKESSVIAAYLPSTQSFRRFCREYGEIKCQS